MDLPALSHRNPHLARLRSLARQRRVRSAAGRAVVDGPVLLSEAVAANVRVEEVFVDPAAADRPEVAAAVEAATAAGASAWTVTGGLRAQADTATPHGVVAIVAPPPLVDLASIEPTVDALWLVLDGVGDPGNAGTLLRTAEAAGASVLVGPGTVDLWSPKAVRSSAGSVFRVAVASGDLGDALRRLSSSGTRAVGTRAASGRPPEEVDLTGPTALVLGSEARGLDPEVAAAVNEWASLPMLGAIESMNVAVAGSVLAFEATRQRRVAAKTVSKP